MSRVKAVVTVLLVVVVVFGLLWYEFVRERGAVEGLRVEVAGASIVRLGVGSCDVVVKLRFVNPSTRDTPTFWVSSYAVYLNSELVGTGSVPPTKVAANSSVYQETTLTVEYSKVSKALVDAILRRELRLEVRGEVRARTLLGLLEISAPFTVSYSLG